MQLLWLMASPDHPPTPFSHKVCYLKTIYIYLNKIINLYYNYEKVPVRVRLHRVHKNGFAHLNFPVEICGAFYYNAKSRIFSILLLYSYLMELQRANKVSLIVWERNEYTVLYFQAIP